MKTLGSKEEIDLIINNSTFKIEIETNTRFQEFYNFMNQFKQMNDQILLSIILPTFNEEKSIKHLLESLPNKEFIEIIVVDDCSTDNSITEVKKVDGKRKIKLLKHKKNQGYGRSIITGIKYASGDVLVTMDSDGQHCPDDILKVVKPIFQGSSYFTIGSRYLGSNRYKLPIRTRLGEAIIEKLLQLSFGQKIMNNQNGFRAFNRKLIPLFMNVKYHGFTFATETIILALINGIKIIECPIKVYERQHGSSKINFLKLILDLNSCFIRYCFGKFGKLIKNRFCSNKPSSLFF